jgi:EmrB/QacA subfamily drug resistance transporter
MTTITAQSAADSMSVVRALGEPGGQLTLPPPAAEPPDIARNRSRGVLALLCAVYFMVILDAAIVRLAIPPIHRDLGSSSAAETWVANAYMLTFGALLLLCGRFADVLGRRRMLLAGVTLFTVASLFCGLAGSSAVLIAARAVQGVGAAAMTPAALSILMRTFPEGAERNKAIGAWSAAGGIGATAAWVIGGPLIDGPGWQWAFWINLPVGIALAALALRMLPESRDRSAPRTFDIAGAVSVTAGLGLLIYALVEAPTNGWGSLRTALLSGGALALLATFVVIERRAAAPLIPRRIARSRTLLAANIGLGGAMASIYGMVFILALYGQQVLGWSALKLGYAGCVLPVSAAIGAGLGQALVTRHGSRPVAIVAMVGLAAGFLLLAGLTVHGDYLGQMLPALVVFGLGLGAAASSFSIATLSGVDPSDAGLASGLNNTFECTFGAVGTALMASVAVTHTTSLLHAGSAALPALNSGFALAFATAIAFPAFGLLASIMLTRPAAPERTAPPAPAPATDARADYELA